MFVTEIERRLQEFDERLKQVIHRIEVDQSKLMEELGWTPDGNGYYLKNNCLLNFKYAIAQELKGRNNESI